MTQVPSPAFWKPLLPSGASRQPCFDDVRTRTAVLSSHTANSRTAAGRRGRSLCPVTTPGRGDAVDGAGPGPLCLRLLAVRWGWPGRPWASASTLSRCAGAAPGLRPSLPMHFPCVGSSMSSGTGTLLGLTGGRTRARPPSPGDGALRGSPMHVRHSLSAAGRRAHGPPASKGLGAWRRGTRLAITRPSSMARAGPRVRPPSHSPLRSVSGPRRPPAWACARLVKLPVRKAPALCPGSLSAGRGPRQGGRTPGRRAHLLAVFMTSGNLRHPSGA